MKKFFLVAFVSILITSSIAQQGSSFQNLINVNTTSPEAASINKFGNIPVSYATGIPGISIPIYEINIGKIKLPISLDYHSGGIRVDETSSSVGIGWALEGIGIISRNMAGLPDELNGANGFVGAPDADLVYANSSAYSTYLYSVQNGSSDAEPDIFQYSIAGQSGKFIFNKDGTVMQIPVTSNKIVFHNGDYFTIVDANGITYTFDQVETTSSSNTMIPTYISSWRLTKMIDANSVDAIYFKYDVACNNSTEHPKSFSFTMGVTSLSCQEHQDVDGGSYNTASAFLGSSENANTQTISHNDSYPSEIDWRGGKIIFTNSCDRTDVTGSGERLRQIDVYSSQNGIFTQVKSVKLDQSYFFSNPISNTTADERNYRLRLDAVEILPINSTSNPQVYSITYNSTAMAPRESYAQDRWGFNNGQFSNGSLLPYQTQLYGQLYYTFGSGSREPDEAFMKACVLSSIQYPTGGKTTFEFEPHQYNTQLPEVTQRSVEADAYGSTTSDNSQSFTVDAFSSAYNYNVFISRFNYDGVTARPTVTLFDETSGQLIMTVSTYPPSATNLDYSTGTQSISLTAGHLYTLRTNLQTTNANVYARANISWTVSNPAVSAVKIGGGLRVKTITNYDGNGKFISQDGYEYGDDNTGIILTPQYYQDINFERVVNRLGCLGGGFASCSYFYENAADINPALGYSLIYHSSSVLPTSQYSGSPVVYRKVTKKQKDALGNSIGKIVYGYQVYQDGSNTGNAPITAPTPLSIPTGGIYLISNTWKNGFQISEDIYASTPSTSTGYTLISSKTNTPAILRNNSESIIKVKPNFLQSGCENQISSNVAADFTLTKVPIQTGAVLLGSTLEVTYDPNGTSVTATQNFNYDDVTHIFPTSKQMINSQGQTVIDNMKYPHDLAASGNVYQKMIDRNITAPVIKDVRQNNGTQMSLANINYYDWFGNSALLLPQTVDQQIMTNSLDTRIKFNLYDIYGNILQQQKTNDVVQSYIWDYQSVYPVAKVLNGASNNIAYTSFEADGTGNWTLNGGAVNTTVAAITGVNSYNLSGTNTIAKTGLASGNYVVSYWTKGGSLTVNGSTTSLVVSHNGWNFYKHSLIGVTTVTVSGTGTLDELRLYPSNAQMTTYTYIPLIGISSQCDANNRLSYYNYDGFGRLKDIKDQDGNILKVYDYQYQQPK